MKYFSSQRFLVVYSAVLTAAFAVIVVSGFTSSPSKLNLKELTVQRINVVEPDGTRRMVISDKHDFPSNNPKRRTAGVLFFNDEGVENGGLIFGGYMGKDGDPVSYGHLSFDKYQQDQTLVLQANQNGSEYDKYFALYDRPNWSLEKELMPLVKRAHASPTKANKAAVKDFLSNHLRAEPRLLLGETEKGVTLNMKDAHGHNRIVLRVRPNGTPVLQFLDAHGKVTAQFPHSSKSQ